MRRTSSRALPAARVSPLALLLALVPASHARGGEMLALELAEDGSIQLRSELAAVDRTSAEAVARAATQTLLDLQDIEFQLRLEASRRANGALLPALSRECRREAEAEVAWEPTTHSGLPRIVSVRAVEHLGPGADRAVTEWPVGERRCRVRVTLRRGDAGAWRISQVEDQCARCDGGGLCNLCRGQGVVQGALCPMCQGSKRCSGCQGSGFSAELFFVSTNVVGRWDVLSGYGGSVEPASTRAGARETLLEIGAVAGRALDAALADLIAPLVPVARETVAALFEDGVVSATPTAGEEDSYDPLAPPLAIARVEGEGSASAEATLVGTQGHAAREMHATLERGDDGLYRLASLREACLALEPQPGHVACELCEGSGEVPVSPSSLARLRP